MIVGIGIDLVEISRLKRSIERFNERFLKRIYTVRELEYCQQKLIQETHYAVRFAAKEAMVKAVGIGVRNGITWQDIEVVNDDMGKPEIRTYGKCKQIMSILKVNRIHISLSHTENYGIAMVVLEK